MKKAIVYIAIIAFLLSALAFAADKPAPDTPKIEPAKVRPLKVASMHAIGKVVEIDENTIKIYRTVKKEAQTMLFILGKAAANIAVNDLVKITYIEKDGQLVANKISVVIPKKKEIK